MLFQPCSGNGQDAGCSAFTDQPISLAMAYVPTQQWKDLYDTSLGLQRGTIFSQLDNLCFHAFLLQSPCHFTESCIGTSLLIAASVNQ